MGWTHAMCEVCWHERSPDGVVPAVLVGADKVRCCFCDGLTSAGICIRYDPANTNCDKESCAGGDNVR